MTSTTPPPAPLPGRAVDIVHAAVQAAGREVFSANVQIGHRPADAPEVTVHVMGTYPGRIEALALFARLGVAPGAVEIVPNGSGSDLGRASADVPGICHLTIITVRAAADPEPEPADPTTLIADVDAARAAADEAEDDSTDQALVSAVLGALADSQAAIDAELPEDDQQCCGPGPCQDPAHDVRRTAAYHEGWVSA